MNEVERTHYEVLGVGESATPERIVHAYRQLMREVHPDLAMGAADRQRRTQRASAINAAYAVLRDPGRRAAYDAQLVLHRAQLAASRPRPVAPARSATVAQPASPPAPVVDDNPFAGSWQQWLCVFGAFLALTALASHLGEAGGPVILVGMTGTLLAQAVRDGDLANPLGSLLRFGWQLGASVVQGALGA